MSMNLKKEGSFCYDLIKELLPVYRSITGSGVVDTLHILQKFIPELKIYSVKSGVKVFDWTVPPEWNIDNAYIEDAEGNRFAEFKKNYLHLVGYSTPVNQLMGLDELKKHIYTIPEKPEAVPYVTSYYSRDWGFCMEHQALEKLRPGIYRAVINSKLKPGSLHYGEVLIPGEKKEEIFLSTYICHPSMANNELSGPAVVAALIRHILSSGRRKFSYRVAFVPETIGSIAYLSKNLRIMKKNVIAGFNVTCVGDERAYSFLPSRDGRTIADKAALRALDNLNKKFIRYTWLNRGSDERQYCAPGVDLPIASIMRSKYMCYPEYHTSLDSLGSVVTIDGLQGSFDVINEAINIIENEIRPTSLFLCEPQLGRRGLYRKISNADNAESKVFLDVLSLCDGTNSLEDIANYLNKSFSDIKNVIKILNDHQLIRVN